jgi:hypothetical protein
VLVVPETISLRLCSGLFDVDGDGDEEGINDDDEQVDIVTDDVTIAVSDIIPELEVLAHADSRDDTEADDESNGLLDDEVDCDNDCDEEIELIEDGDKLFDIDFMPD